MNIRITSENSNHKRNVYRWLYALFIEVKLLKFKCWFIEKKYNVYWNVDLQNKLFIPTKVIKEAAGAAYGQISGFIPALIWDFMTME